MGYNTGVTRDKQCLETDKSEVQGDVLLTYQAHCFKPITAAVEPAMAWRKSKSHGVLSYLKMTRCLEFSTGPNHMIATHVPPMTHNQVTVQWRMCQSLKEPFNSPRWYVHYLIPTAEDLFKRMNIDYKFLYASSVGGIANHQDKYSSVGNIENRQYNDGGIENHQNKSTVGDMKNHLLNVGCLFVMHVQSASLKAVVLAFMVWQFILVVIGLLSAIGEVKRDWQIGGAYKTTC